MLNLKKVGLALAAVLAMSAMAASTALATAPQFHSEIENTTITGAQSGLHEFTTDAGTVKCEVAKFAGSQAAKTTTTVEITPTYEGCEFIGLEFNVKTNGCKYLFHLNNETGSDPYEGTTDIICPAGQFIEVGISGICLVKVGSQNGLGTVTYSNMLNGGGAARDVTVNANVNNIVYNESGFLCNRGNTTGGTYKGLTTVQGENSSGVGVGTWVE